MCCKGECACASLYVDCVVDRRDFDSEKPWYLTLSLSLIMCCCFCYSLCYILWNSSDGTNSLEILAEKLKIVGRLGSRTFWVKKRPKITSLETSQKRLSDNLLARETIISLVMQPKRFLATCLARRRNDHLLSIDDAV